MNRLYSKAVLLSIKDKFARAIFAGKKKAELRLRPPSVSHGDVALVYVSSPVKCLLGGFFVKELITTSPRSLWKHVRALGIEQTDFNDYFDGRTTASAIWISHRWLFNCPIPLHTLREQLGGFVAPQNFRYLSESEFSKILVLGKPLTSKRRLGLLS